MSNNSFPFQKIINQQLSFKSNYKKGINPPGSGICIVIKNNKISQVINGHDWIHPSRKEQFIQLIMNCLQKYSMNDCNININLTDHPMPGVFNFGRVKDSSFFLLPNHRFTNDDIKIDDRYFDDYDQQKRYILECKSNNKINKIYNSSIPHREKVHFFKYALNNTDICDSYAFTGSCHKLVALDRATNRQLESKNMSGTKHKDWIEHLKYKYLIYTDGNTLSDRMRLLLCSKSIIIRAPSFFEEFYTYLLKNNLNYVLCNDINDLRSIYNNLESDFELCSKIIDSNTYFVENILTYDNILYYCQLLINGLTE